MQHRDRKKKLRCVCIKVALSDEPKLWSSYLRLHKSVGKGLGAGEARQIKMKEGNVMMWIRRVSLRACE